VDQSTPGPEGNPPAANQGSFIVPGSPDEAVQLAGMREALGDEAVGHYLRTRDRAQRSRPLTAAERADLQAALDPVLRDLAASGAIMPVIQDEGANQEARYEEEFVLVWFRSADGTGAGIYLPPGPPTADQVARVADQVQEWEIEELAAAARPATWPGCPLHPGSHPLAAEVDGDVAVWRCPRGARPVIGAIGALPPGP
jgi:hypothetical protein